VVVDAALRRSVGRQDGEHVVRLLPMPDIDEIDLGDLLVYDEANDAGC
jgi:hypothetical protein